MKKYYLLLWPESQKWIDHPEAICVGYGYSENDDLSLDQAVFVPCETYDKIYGGINGWTRSYDACMVGFVTRSLLWW